MQQRWKGIGLKARVVMALAVAILAIQAIYVLIEERRFEGQLSRDFQATADNLALLYAGAVANSVWEYDRDAAEAQLQAMRVINGFAEATIRETDGQMFVTVSAAPEDGEDPGRLTSSADILIDGRAIGEITVALSLTPLAAAQAQHLRTLITTNGAIAAALLGLTLLALHLATRPLDRMTLLMQRFSTGELDSNVPYTERSDEIGRMARALEVFRDNAVERRIAEENLQRRSRELAEANELLLRARDAADKANRTKSDFLASMSHEIRTPMNGVIGMVHLLKNSPLTPDQHDKLSTLESSAKGLLSLLDDILDISKIEAGRLDLNLAPFSMHDLIADLVALWRPSALSKKLSLDFEIDRQVPPVLIGDSSRIGQVLANFLGNAVKFTHQGGIRLKVAATPLAGGRHAVTFAVLDSGIGIAPEVQPRLFQKFSQADASMTRRYGGTGLGLAICRELTQLMGGEVGVQSEPGKGSTFWMRLELQVADELVASRDELDMADRSLLRQVGTRKLSLLVAEDNVINQKVICALLEAAGHTTALAADGNEAVAAVQHSRFDAVLMDVQMPKMDGIMATRQIRSLGGTYADLPIIALTANAMTGDRERYLAAGMNDYVSKPIEPEKLSLALRRCCGGDVATLPGSSAPQGRTDASAEQQSALADLLTRI
ncbi:two-component system sensor histidine kinase BarA [Dongia mobilis]|uniref:Sensory/regulatory protein RpfC n=1 Tax=Dongia mobilis TaxID=578943 RepID=A0A4R6X0P0_9PROT|nr:ATP-binding protein [Dongia mobilis]TDQ84018.1 two-component system sensor histidine kinase BarA [Dongia mobilis]